MSGIQRFFSLMRETSRFWLPPFLDEVAKLPPSITDGDSCSIYLAARNEPYLHLAATMRGALRHRLFDQSARYSTERSRLEHAAGEKYGRDGDLPLEVGLTGWAAAYNRPLRIADLNNTEEILAYEDKQAGIPPPVWSKQCRSRFDEQSPRPMLIVPMRYEKQVTGVIRVTKFRPNASPFSKEHEAALQCFADTLADFLQSSEMLDAGIAHYFKLWSTNDADRFAERITRAVPKLLNVGSCSFFLRTATDQFVLRHSSADAFVRDNKDNLYYTRLDGSKTSRCIRSQAPVLLWRSDGGDWSTDEVDQTSYPIKSGGAYLDGREPPEVRCELKADETRSLLIVPVRDVVSPGRLVGVLRVASARDASENEDVARSRQREYLKELEQFASGLASLIVRPSGEQLKREMLTTLTQELQQIRAKIKEGKLDKKHLLCAAAEGIGNCVNASAVTIFLREGNELYTKGDYSFLTRKLYGQHEWRKEKFHFFQQAADRIRYKLGEERTGWSAGNGEVLNLRNLNDEAELLRKHIIKKQNAICEIDDPGPFLAAPISADGGKSISGVIRAVRREETVYGSFSIIDELMIRECGAVLANVVPTRVVVSYPSAHVDTVRAIQEGTESLNLDFQYVVGRTSGDPGKKFLDMLKQADIGIVVAIADGGKTISPEITLELGQIQGKLGACYLVLVQDGTEIPNPGAVPEKNLFRYSSTAGGILTRMPELVREIRALRDCGSGMACPAGINPE